MLADNGSFGLRYSFCFFYVARNFWGISEETGRFGLSACCLRAIAEFLALLWYIHPLVLEEMVGPTGPLGTELLSWVCLSSSGLESWRAPRSRGRRGRGCYTVPSRGPIARITATSLSTPDLREGGKVEVFTPSECLFGHLSGVLTPGVQSSCFKTDGVVAMGAS